jgi:tRNA-specific 2-thiouridylase
MTKDEVRAYARKKGLPVAGKKDSQGICFIGKVALKEFLAPRVRQEPGPIVSVDGERLGTHGGLAPFTVGQRHGLGTGGGGEPWFVVEKRPQANALVVARGERHPALYRDRLVVADVSWVAGEPPEFPLRCRARIRYRQPLQDCMVAGTVPERGLPQAFDVRFARPQRAAAPGQFAVFYDGHTVLGGGVIQ